MGWKWLDCGGQLRPDRNRGHARAGGTMCQVVQDIIDRGAIADNIRVVSIVAASPALTKMSQQFPGLRVYTAMIDAEVNEQGFIIPGLGDAGDRCYATGPS